MTISLSNAAAGAGGARPQDPCTPSARAGLSGNLRHCSKWVEMPRRKSHHKGLNIGKTSSCQPSTLYRQECVLMEFSGAPDACPRSPEAGSQTQRLMPPCCLETAGGRAVEPPVPEVLKDSGYVPGERRAIQFTPTTESAEETLPS